MGQMWSHHWETLNSSPLLELVPRGLVPPQPPGSGFKPKGMMLILCADIFLLHNSSVEMEHLWLSQTFKKAATSSAFCTILPHGMVGKKTRTLIPFAQTQATAFLAAPHPTEVVRLSVSGCWSLVWTPFLVQQSQSKLKIYFHCRCQHQHVLALGTWTSGKAKKGGDMNTPKLALLKVWKSSLHRNLHSHDRDNRCHSWTPAASGVLLAWLLLHVPVLFLGQHSKNLQVTVLVPWGVCRLDLCLTGVKNSFYILVTNSEVSDTVQIKHTFKVRIFRAWEERRYCTMQQEKQHITHPAEARHTLLASSRKLSCHLL